MSRPNGWPNPGMLNRQRFSFRGFSGQNALFTKEAKRLLEILGEPGLGATKAVNRPPSFAISGQLVGKQKSLMLLI